MAQVLKEEVRNTILENARKEFSDVGFENASMRSIAAKSKMTVGNLYRYFKSKDDLNETIVSPTYKLIDELVARLTGGKLRLGDSGEVLNVSPEDLSGMLQGLSSGLVDIYKDHRIEINILMMGSKLNKELTAWVSSAIADLISASYKIDKSNPVVKTLSICYADAIFGGMKTILKNAQQYDETLKKTVSIYLNSYLMMLQHDVLDSLTKEA